MAAWKSTVVVLVQLCCFYGVFGYTIEIVPECVNTWSLGECPEFLPTLLAPPSDSHAAPEGAPRMEFGELPDTQMVGNLTVYVKVHNYSSYVVRLILSARDVQPEVRCLNVPADRDTSAVSINCIRMVRDPSALLAVQIFQIRRNPCGCDVTGGCGRLCSTVISTHTKETSFQIGKEACLTWKKSHLNSNVNITLLMKLRSRHMASVKVYARNANPYASIAISVHADHMHTVQPICETYLSTQLARRELLMNERCDLRKFSGHRSFYAKLSMYCTGVYPYTEHTSPTTQLGGHIPKPVPNPEVEPSDPRVGSTGGDDGADEDDDMLLYGVLAGLVVIAVLLTTAVWHGVKRCRSRQKLERLPSVEYSSDDRPYASLLKSSQSRPGSTPRPVMLLAHPDSDVHEKALKDFTRCLETHKYSVVGQVKDCSQNWSDMADGVGNMYRDVIVVMSQGLYDLCKEYKVKHSKENDKWDQLLQKRNGEFLPCVVLDALRTCYFHHEGAFRVHCISFDYKNISSESHIFPSLVNEFIAANHLFLQYESNTFKYVIAMREFQAEANSNTADNNVRPGLSRLLHNLSYFSESDELTLSLT